MPLDMFGPPGPQMGPPPGAMPGMPPGGAGMPPGMPMGAGGGAPMPPMPVPGGAQGGAMPSVIPPEIRAQLPPELQAAPDAVIFQFLEQWQRSKGDMFTPPSAPPPVPNGYGQGMPPQQQV